MRLLYTFVFILFTSISNPAYSLIKGKDDITQKSSHNLFKHAELGKFTVRF
jgi:hypothetical protein